MNGFASALSTAPDTKTALSECVTEASHALGTATPRLAVLFATPHHDLSDQLSRVHDATGADNLLGCVAESVVGTGREVEAGPAMSLWLAALPNAAARPFRLEVEQRAEALEVRGTPEIDADYAKRDTSILVLGDPFSFPADHWLNALNEQFPSLPVVGGMASGAMAPGQSRLFHGDEIVNDGAVGVLLEHARIATIVSQGSRPIGNPMVITRGHDNVIEQLAGQSPMAALQKIFENAQESEQLVIQQALQTGGLHLGRVVDEHISKPGRGDFLVRGVLGVDKDTGSIAIGDYAKVGRTVSFLVRDAASADEDLREMLASAGSHAPAGALVFSCNGRGTRMFDAPDHDASCVRDAFGEIPVAGFFAAGEIGPVGGSNFVHGFTASLAVFLSE